MSIRWKRGFFRVWVVFAVLWIAAEAWIQTRPFVPTPDDLFGDVLAAGPRTRSGCEETAKREPRVDVEACVENAHTQNWRDASKVMWVLLPPVLILMFGIIAGWIIQGFRP